MTRNRWRGALAIVCGVWLFVPGASGQQPLPATASVDTSKKQIRIDTIDPNAAAAGARVTVTGSGFGARNAVITVGGVRAVIVSATGNKITFLVPPGPAPGPAAVTVTNPGGHVGSINFTVSAPQSACPAGSFGDGVNGCTPCAPGTYSDKAGAAACTACPAGRFSASSGATACTQCAAGTYSDQS